MDLITVYLAFREDLFGIRELTIVERFVIGQTVSFPPIFDHQFV